MKRPTQQGRGAKPPTSGPPADLEGSYRLGELTVVSATRGPSGLRVITARRGRALYRRIEWRGDVWWERV